jgi:hypothetical protein
MTCEPPTIWIALPYEGRPSVRLSAGLSEEDRTRLLVWLQANPRLLGIVGESIELGHEAEALR